MSVLKKSLAALGVCAVAASAISFEPVTAGATESAKKLYNFLAVNYGVKTITGVQTGDIADTYDALPDVISFEEHSGKKPVLVGLDFLFANGIKASDSWYKAYTQSAVDAAKDIWAKILAATQIACGIPIQKLTSKSSKTSPKLQFTLNSYKTQVLLQYFVRCTKQAAHGSGGVLTAEPLTKLFIN